MSEKPPAQAGLDTLRLAMTRASEREGIPMIVALVDERGPMAPVASDGVAATGRALAALVSTVHEDIAPTMADGDNGGVINALVIAAHNLTEMTTTHG